MTANAAGQPATSQPARMARVVNVRDAATYIYVGRGSAWGNRFSHRPSSHDVVRVATRTEAIERYRIELWQRIQTEGRPFIEQLAALHGQTLGCYCYPLPCHGDVLVRAAAWAARWLQQHPARAA